MHEGSSEAAAGPTEALLRSMEANGSGRLELPGISVTERTLPGLQLGADTLRRRLAGGEIPPWWDGERPSFRGAALAGADLPDADFTGADLSQAAFAGTALRSARLRGATLEGADLAGCDLSGADMRGVQAGQAIFTAALMEDVSLAGAMLRHADLSAAVLDGANLDDADLWGCILAGAEMVDSSLRKASLQEAKLCKANLSGADLTGAELKKADLEHALLKGADLRGADLARTSLAWADLQGAKLARVDLSSCDLRGVRLAGAWLESTRLSLQQLGDGLGEELVGDFGEARQGYFALEQNFRGLGDPEAARACYLRGRRMGKRHAKAVLVRLLRERHLRPVPRAFANWAGDAFAEWLCDYGESLSRVLRAFVSAVLCFALYYGVTGSLVNTGEGALRGTPSHHPLELLGYSFLNMCSSGVPDLGLRPGSQLVLFISSLQYVVGLVLIGLFGYVLGNRIRR